MQSENETDQERNHQKSDHTCETPTLYITEEDARIIEELRTQGYAEETQIELMTRLRKYAP